MKTLQSSNRDLFGKTSLDSVIAFAFSAVLPTCEILYILCTDCIFYVYFESAMYFVLSCADMNCVLNVSFGNISCDGGFEQENLYS